MNLQELLSPLGVPLKAHPSMEDSVVGIFNDARLVQPQSIFVAIAGSRFDGHQFLADAVARGASALVVQDATHVPKNFKGVVVEVHDSRQAVNLLASAFYGHPSQQMFCVGVTGTNGKTSITYMVEALLNAGQMATGVIGTVDHHLLSKVWPSDMTTPDPISVQRRLREFVDAGAKAVAMEVSSHALDQKRVDGVSFDAAVFTNLTRDHLDYHGDMHSYMLAKQRLFNDLLQSSKKQNTFAIINVGDETGRKLLTAKKAGRWSYGSSDADFRHEVLQMGFSSTRFRLSCPHGNAEFCLSMAGEHNVLNAVAAIAVALAAGLTLDKCVEALQNFSGVPGRLQSVPGAKDLSVFVDYAHSPDALDNVLRSLQRVRADMKSRARIWTIFGCGGDRDKGKRPLMLEVALQLSDNVIVTSDNPRTEDPHSIIQDIVSEMHSSSQLRVHVEVDRQKAIEDCIAKAQAGDVILIAGKGHEDYQIFGQTKTPFSDFKVATHALEKRGK